MSNNDFTGIWIMWKACFVPRLKSSQCNVYKCFLSRICSPDSWRSVYIIFKDKRKPLLKPIDLILENVSCVELVFGIACMWCNFQNNKTLLKCCIIDSLSLDVLYCFFVRCIRVWLNDITCGSPAWHIYTSDQSI